MLGKGVGNFYSGLYVPFQAHVLDLLRFERSDLEGSETGDLPIEQPMRFDLTVNMKTAKALGLTMPPEMMVRATKVIQ